MINIGTKGDLIIGAVSLLGFFVAILMAAATSLPVLVDEEAYDAYEEVIKFEDDDEVHVLYDIETTEGQACLVHSAPYCARSCTCE